MKRLVSLLSAFIMLFAGAALPQEAFPLFDSSITASAAGISINATKVIIFALSSDFGNALKIPSSLNKSFTLKVSGAKNVTYSVKSGEGVKVSSSGVITPAATTWYWYGSFGATFKMGDSEPTAVVDEYTFGSNVVRVNADGKIFDVTVNVKDYADYYVNKKVDDYLAKNIKSTMSVAQKIETVCKLVASYDYDVHYSSAVSMVIYGGGDCWASTDLVIMACKKLGFDAWARNGNRDYGAGSGHMNAMVLAGGKYYEVEAGYGGTAPRMYNFFERTSIYSYRPYADGIQIYQYDGKQVPAVVNIPAEINGQKVLSLGEDLFYMCDTVKEINVPEGVISIFSSVFCECPKLEKLTLPSTLMEVGRFTITNLPSLKTFTLGEGNQYFTLENGVLYDKAKTILYYCPKASTIKIPSTVKTIADYAFYHNHDIKSVTIPNSVTSIGEGAFGDCSSLTSVKIGSGVRTLADFAFANTEKLLTLEIPKSVTSVGDFCFGFINDWFEDGGADKNRLLLTEKGSAAETYAKKNGVNYSTAKNISGCSITLSASSFTYNGAANLPTVTVKDSSGKKLVKNTDYTLTYKNTTNAGTATVTITGKGSYAGKVSKTYKITPLALSSSTVKVTMPYGSYNYTGKARKPQVTLKDKKGSVIPAGSYTVSCKNNKNVGVATVTVKGDGKNVTGSLSSTFIIKPAKNAVKSLTAKNGGFVVKWNKATSGAVGYQVLYSRSKSAIESASGAVKGTNASNRVYSYTTTDLKKLSKGFAKDQKTGETWYVKVRSFYTKDGKTTSTRYGSYSDIKAVKIK